MTCPTCGEMDGDYIPCPVCGNCVSCHAEYHIACGSIDGIDAAGLPAKYLDRPPVPINLKELNETIVGVLEDVVRQFVERRQGAPGRPQKVDGLHMQEAAEGGDMTGRRLARSAAVCVDGAPIDWGRLHRFSRNGTGSDDEGHQNGLEKHKARHARGNRQDIRAWGRARQAAWSRGQGAS